MEEKKALRSIEYQSEHGDEGEQTTYSLDSEGNYSFYQNNGMLKPHTVSNSATLSKQITEEVFLEVEKIVKEAKNGKLSGEREGRDDPNPYSCGRFIISGFGNAEVYSGNVFVKIMRVLESKVFPNLENLKPDPFSDA